MKCDIIKRKVRDGKKQRIARNELTNWFKANYYMLISLNIINLNNNKNGLFCEYLLRIYYQNEIVGKALC